MLQHDRERLASAFLRVDRLTTALVLPSFLGMSLVAPELISVVFGNSWQGAGPVAAVLFLIGAVYSVGAFSSAAFNGAGHPGVAFRLQLISTITNVVGFFIAAAIFGSLIAVASAFVLRGYLLLALNLYWLRLYVGVSLRRYFLQLRGVALASLGMAGAVLVLKLALLDSVSLPVVLGAEVLAGALVFATVLRLADPPLFRELSSFARSALLGRGKRGKRGRFTQESAETERVDRIDIAGESHTVL
jgi:PST family polysaccharide transporter